MKEKTAQQIENMKNGYRFGVEVEMNGITRRMASKIAATVFGTNKYENTAWRNEYMTWSARRHQVLTKIEVHTIECDICGATKKYECEKPTGWMRGVRADICPSCADKLKQNVRKSNIFRDVDMSEQELNEYLELLKDLKLTETDIARAFKLYGYEKKGDRDLFENALALLRYRKEHPEPSKKNLMTGPLTTSDECSEFLQTLARYRFCENWLCKYFKVSLSLITSIRYGQRKLYQREYDLFMDFFFELNQYKEGLK